MGRRVKRLGLIALALASCNQVYGLDPTRFGERIDAPPACKDVLEFIYEPVRVASTGGFPLTYNTDEARTIAVASQFKVVEGTADADDLRPAVFEPMLPAGTTADLPRLAPEGDELFVRLQENQSNTRLVRYTRNGARWDFAAKVSLALTAQSEVSSPTRRLPGGRRMVIRVPTGLQEYVESAPDTWMPIGEIFPKPDALGSTEQPNLTADGLRAIYVTNPIGASVVRYVSRVDVTQPWSEPRDLPPFFGRPSLNWPFLTADCGRFYALTAYEGVFYLKQP